MTAAERSPSSSSGEAFLGEAGAMAYARAVRAMKPLALVSVTALAMSAIGASARQWNLT